MQHAHSAGVVHRDIKPANIIVTTRLAAPDGTRGERVKVTDFGIARAVGDSTLTATGSVLGTANYLSPEQASGGTIGPAADQYSTGIVLYEMLVGVVPFTGDSPVAIAMRHMSDKLPPPSTLNPDVPEALDAIVMRSYGQGAPIASPMPRRWHVSFDTRSNQRSASAGGGRTGGGGSPVLAGSMRHLRLSTGNRPDRRLESAARGSCGARDLHRAFRRSRRSCCCSASSRATASRPATSATGIGGAAAERQRPRPKTRLSRSARPSPTISSGNQSKTYGVN